MRAIVIISLILLLLLPSAIWAQEAELKALCRELDGRLGGNQPLHVKYLLTVKGRQAGQEQRMQMDLYKKGDLQDLVMGEAQEVLQQGRLQVVVNHVQKLIQVQEDASGAGGYSFMKDFGMFIDSAVSCQKTQAEGALRFTLAYGNDFIYKRVVFTFSEKSRQLTSLYAEFASGYPEPYHSFSVDYELWDMQWKPGADFPGVARFVSISGNSYNVQQPWKGYRLYQPQKAILK